MALIEDITLPTASKASFLVFADPVPPKSISFSAIKLNIAVGISLVKIPSMNSGL